MKFPEEEEQEKYRQTLKSIYYAYRGIIFKKAFLDNPQTYVIKKFANCSLPESAALLTINDRLKELSLQSK